MELYLDKDKLYVFSASSYEQSSDLSVGEARTIHLGIIKNMCLYSEKVINPLIVKDFNTSIGVEFKDCGWGEEENKLLDAYLRDVKRIDVWGRLEALIDEKLKQEGVKKQSIVGACAKWLAAELDKWNLILRKEVVKEIIRLHGEKCKKKQGVFNLSKGSIDMELSSLLNLGKNSVPSFKLTKWRRLFNLEQAVIRCLRTYRAVVQGGKPIQGRKVIHWLRAAINLTKVSDGEDSKHHMYYSQVLKRWPSIRNRFFKMEALGENQGKLEEMMFYEGSKYRGLVCNEADKGLGMAVMKTDDIKGALNKMVRELGGRLTHMTGDECLEVMRKEIEKFEGGLTDDQLEMINMLSGSSERKVLKCKVPYLKLNLKLQKYKVEDLKNLNPAEAKYRPIQDSIGSPLKPYSMLCMEVIRMLNDRIRMKYPAVNMMETKNGADFSRFIRRMDIPGRYKVIMSTDLESAYTNIKLRMIEHSLINCGYAVGWESWRIELALKLIKLLLSNNYVEVPEGIFLLGDQLAMGCSSSGDALDNVCMWQEVKAFYDVVEIRVHSSGQYSANLHEFERVEGEKLIKENENEMINCVKRYRDDCITIVSGKEIGLVKSVIVKVGGMYPAGIGNNAKFSHIYGSHLDCCFMLRLGGGEAITFIRRELKYPLTIIPPSSKTPNWYKTARIRSEAVRYQRICSDSSMVRLNMELLKREYRAVGYTGNYVKRAYRSLSYNKSGRDEEEGSEGAGENCVEIPQVIKYQGEIENELIRRLLQPSRGGHLKWQFLYKNERKVKNYVISRRKDLHRMKEVEISGSNE